MTIENKVFKPAPAAVVVCQSCEGEIDSGAAVVRVSYGKLYWTAHPHSNVKRAKLDDYFHEGCPVMIRENLSGGEK